MKDTQGENLDLNDRADDNTQFLETVQEAAAPEAAPEDGAENAKNGGERTAGGDEAGAEQNSSERDTCRYQEIAENAIFAMFFRSAGTVLAPAVLDLVKPSSVAPQALLVSLLKNGG